MSTNNASVGANTDDLGNKLYARTEEADKKVIDTLTALSSERGV